MERGTQQAAPPEENQYTQYYEGRIYGIGLIKGRPFDLASLVLSYNQLSRTVLDARYPGQRAAGYAVAAIASYSYRVTHGVFVQPGLGVVKNPLPSPQVPLAVNVYLSLALLI